MKSTRSKADKQVAAQPWLTMLKAALIASALTIILILLFALLLKLCIVNESWIAPVNQVLKVLGIALTAFLTTKRPMKALWFKGGLSGVLYILLGIIIFSLIEGEFSFNSQLLTDIGMGFIIGIVVAFIRKLKK